MKKINIILGACALVCAGALVSCKQEPTEMVNVTAKTYTNHYTVTGTITETSTETSTTKNDSTTTTNVSSSTITNTIKSGNATVSWKDSEVSSGNIDATYEVSLSKLTGTKKSVYKSKYGDAAETTDSDSEWEYNDQSAEDLGVDDICIYDIDGTLYFETSTGNVVTVSSTDFANGESFTLSVSDSWTSSSYASDDSSSATKESIAYSLTFTAK